MSSVNKKVPLVLHILFCVVAFLMPLLAMSKGDEIDYRFYLSYLIHMGGLIFIFYINYLFLIDKFLFKRKFIHYFVINALIIIAVVAIRNVLGDIVWASEIIGSASTQQKEESHPKPPPAIMRYLGDYISMVFFVGMSVALRATMRWHKDSINLESIKAHQFEADLKNLRSQLNPHFLFNTLNNIYSLIAIDKQKAQESVHRLSGMLRYILYDNDHKFVPIDKELEFTKNYIDLMALRLSEKVKLDVSINNANCRNEIASLLFITLIENAFKHGINNDGESFIDIKIFVEKDKGVLCTVANSLNKGNINMESKNSGIGLNNLQKKAGTLIP